MEQVKPWIKAFRRAIKVSVGTGWTVQPDRGNIRLLYGTKKQVFNQLIFNISGKKINGLKL